ELGGRSMVLQEPTSKMSTTFSSEQGAVYVADEPDVIRKKFKTAVTDSEREIRYDPERKPGVSNLLEIMSVATGEPIEALERRFEDAGYGDLKEAVGESVVELLRPPAGHGRRHLVPTERGLVGDQARDLSAVRQHALQRGRSERGVRPPADAASTRLLAKERHALHERPHGPHLAHRGRDPELP